MIADSIDPPVRPPVLRGRVFCRRAGLCGGDLRVRRRQHACGDAATVVGEVPRRRPSDADRAGDRPPVPGALANSLLRRASSPSWT